MQARREMFRILMLICAVFGFQRSQAQVFIGDLAAPGILWSNLPDPSGDFNILDLSFTLIRLPAGSLVDSIAFYESQDTIYWCDFGGNKISRIQLDGTSREEIVDTGYPIDIALDAVNEKIYWSNYNANTVGMANLDGTESRIIFQESASPVSLLVDPINMYLLWSTRDDWTTRGDLMGGNQRTVLSNTLRGMVNEECGDGTTRLYYITEKSNTLGFTNFDHGTVNVLAVIQDEIEVANSLTKYAAKLFWRYQRPDKDLIYEYDMTSSTLRILDRSTVMLSSGTNHTFSPRSIFIYSEVIFDQPVMIEGCPESFSVSLDQGSISTPVSWPEPKLNSLANCPRMDFVGDVQNGGNFSTGVFDLTYNATDSTGNTDVCSFTVTVLPFVQNECELDIDNCDANAMCTDIPDGTFTCTCNEGFTGNGTTCTDIDECTLNTDNCDANALCSNEPAGSFTCTCSEGYTGNGINCRDINECAQNTDNCDANARCTNEPAGSFTCICILGYTGNGTVCTDLDECTLNTDNCDANALCTNEPAGSFTCTCNEGYTGNGTTCSEGAQTSTISMTSSDCDGDQSGSGSTSYSFYAILRTLCIAALFIIALK